MGRKRNRKKSKSIRFPLFVLMDDKTKPLIMKDGDLRVWPLFASKEDALAFSTATRIRHKIAGEVVSARKLLPLMEYWRVKVPQLSEVWRGECLEHGSRVVQFLDRQTADEFFDMLRKQAEIEDRDSLN